MNKDGDFLIDWRKLRKKYSREDKDYPLAAKAGDEIKWMTDVMMGSKWMVLVDAVWQCNINGAKNQVVCQYLLLLRVFPLVDC